MSHVTSLQLHVKDLDCLKKSLPELGMEMIQQPTFRWFGTHVGDYPLPEGFKKEDMGKCDYALRLKNNNRAYEVGVVKSKTRPGEYELLWDFWQGGYGLQKVIGNGGEKLKQSYALQVSKKHLQTLNREGFRTQQVRKPDGTIILKATRG